MTTDDLIFVLEDDHEVQFVYDQILGPRYHLKMFDHLQDLQRALSSPDGRRPRVIIADLRLPDGMLTDLLKKDTELFQGCPLIIISSLDDLDVVRNCYDFGATDYLTKPFGKGELIVKLERVLLKKTEVEKNDLFKLNQSTLTVDRGDRRSAMLTMKEFQIMTLFERASGQCVSRQDVINAVWRGVTVTPKTFDVHLFNLRRKLESIDLEVRFTPPQFYRIYVLEKRLTDYVCEV